MINKFIIISLLLTSFSVFGVIEYNGSTTAAVNLAGGIVKAKQIDTIDKKYKRKDCPVCKGKGWYVSGDEISKVPCGYCEPDTQQQPETPKTRVIKK